MPKKLDELLALLAQDEGDLDDTELLALWFLRSYLLVDDLDSYEFLRPELLDDLGANAFHWRTPDSPDAPPTLVLIRAIAGNGEFGDTSVSELSIGVEAVRALGDVRDASAEQLPAPLVEFLAAKFRKKRDAAGPTPSVVGYVASGAEASGPAAEVAKQSDGAIRIFDATELEPYAKAMAKPELVDAEREFRVPAGEALEITREEKTIVCPVPASEIVQWPGIEDRSLFDLNVRFALGSNRVRVSLNRAIAEKEAHADFLAQHNGLTVLCSAVELREQSVYVRDLSVVNGAQTVVAFYENEPSLDDELRVFVKFIEADPATDLARQIAIRSNTQNPVSPRNLRALDPRQLALDEEFKEKGLGIEYLTRPDVELRSDETHIRNDDAAQWLAAVYNERPWLAVKRAELFSDANYKNIFSIDIHAAQILFCRDIRTAVEAVRGDIPARYEKSWRLTALVAVYLIGQLLRTSDPLQEVLSDPGDVPGAHADLLSALAAHAAKTLEANAESRADEDEDDFKVDFKSQPFLRRLGARARSTYEGAGG